MDISEERPYWQRYAFWICVLIAAVAAALYTVWAAWDAKPTPPRRRVRLLRPETERGDQVEAKAS